MILSRQIRYVVHTKYLSNHLTFRIFAASDFTLCVYGGGSAVDSI